MISVEVNIQRQVRTGADSRLSSDKGDDSKGSARSDDEDERRIATEECHHVCFEMGKSDERKTTVCSEELDFTLPLTQRKSFIHSYCFASFPHAGGAPGSFILTSPLLTSG
jgi:hypothetical protein